MSMDLKNDDTDFNSRDFDASLRQHHAQAVANLSARTQAQLQTRRRAAAAPIRHAPLRGYAWPLAAACAVGVLAMGSQWRQADFPLPAATPVAVAPGSADAAGESAADEFDAYTMLDEAPDLYLWLASNDAATLAME
uniref:Uncharacterized protein n=1 Tax=uncultured bacterium Lac36W TaxID=1403001 RepID=A0A059QCQ7_9BACT|nr:hypothetical protein [uncultured bacterium Lac36W]